MADFEKLGVFYLGRTYDVTRGASGDGLVLYDSRDLVTHALCVGMTGSGKTGLCISLLEEAALDGIPAIAIDPKGDLSNLLLTFPDLRPEDFRPWVNEDDARAKGLTPDQYATRQAEQWRQGLAAWGEDGERIRRLRAAAEFAVYTPGSTAGIPLSIMASFAAPPPAIRDDPELLAERVGTTTTGLLALLGITADPIQSREHILLATLFDATWKAGRDLDLRGLIQQIQKPPVDRIGVLDLEAFYPERDRFSLATRVNNLLAAPGFGPWLQGEPLDVGRILYTPAGKPRVAVMYIAHLSDAERMFFVCLLLNQVLGWMRTQSGTSSLRAILYMDEIFGFFPPVAEPPAKRPLLSLLKQARAFGVGIVLATQNPVDLDYKGLANTGTWLIGRLQTDRDKARVLEGLEGAAVGKGGFNRAEIDTLLSGLKSRIFLMHNVHEDTPVVFETRWAMSYLRGPLTREQVKTLSGQRPEPDGAAKAESRAEPVPARASVAPAPVVGQSRPMLSPEIPQHFLPLPSPVPAGAAVTYTPALYGAATLRFTDERKKIDMTREVAIIAPLREGAVPVDWAAAAPVNVAPAQLGVDPAVAQAGYAPLPAPAARAKSYDGWMKEFARWLYQNQAVTLFRSATTGLLSRPEETEGDFRVRVADAFREGRDAETARLREKYAPKIMALTERIRRAEQAVAREREQAQQQRLQTAVSVGATILGAFVGRKAVSATTLGRATTAARGMGRAAREAQDIGRAVDTVEALKAQLADLEAQFEAETGAAAGASAAQTEALESVSLKPKRTQITVTLVTLAWSPRLPQ